MSHYRNGIPIKTRLYASFLLSPWSLFLLLIAALLSGCGADKSSEAAEVLFEGSVMGTTYHVKLANHTDNEKQRIEPDLGQSIHQRLSDLDKRFTTYQPASELMMLNAAPLHQPIPVSKEMIAVLLLAKAMFDLTEGAFDPSVGPLVDLWGFGATLRDDQIPPKKQIQKMLLSIGFNGLSIDVAKQVVIKTKPVILDLSAIAKGYAVDQVAALLTAKGFNNYLVEVGGELRASGRKSEGRPWRIAVERPSLQQGLVQQAITLENKAVATSGNYRNFFEVNGQRYSHTIDPRTGYPVQHAIVSATVITDESARADALATAFMVMGHEAALALAEQHKMAVYLLVLRNDKITSLNSTAFDTYLQEGK